MGGDVHGLQGVQPDFGDHAKPFRNDLIKAWQ